VLATILLAGCGSPYYTADPIEAWVVDAETGKPIEGAVVTANWQLVSTSLDTGGRKLRQLEVMETTTDKQGRFHFPGFTRINFTLDELREEDPQILIFKSGYRYMRSVNRYPDEGRAAGVKRSSSATGKTLRLELGNADPAKYALQLRPMMSSLENITMLDGASRVPKMLKALSCEKYRLKSIDKSIPFSIPVEPANLVSCATD
jgi:hypothetical protein